MTQRKLRGRLSRPYPGTWHDAHSLVQYEPLTGAMQLEPEWATYRVTSRRSKDGYNTIRLPLSLALSQRGNRHVGVFRCDHIAWMLSTGRWPDGWIEHIDGVMSHDAIDNLVHVDEQGLRWWWGVMETGEEPALHLIASEERSNGYEGAVIYQKIMSDGKMRWVPQKAASLTDAVPSDAYEKGEFGVDWGVVTSEVTEG